MILFFKKNKKINPKIITNQKKIKEHVLINFNKKEQLLKDLEKFQNCNLYKEFKKNIVYYNQNFKYDLFFAT